MTETKRRLFLWFPMWAGRLLLLCYTKILSPQGGFGQARRLSAHESKSISWLTNEIRLASQEIKYIGRS
jgi:hypothetical protein